MPPLIYGTAWKKDRTTDLVVQAVRAGFRGIDTACQPKHYSEHLVGEALQRLSAEGVAREALYVQTKFTSIGGHDHRVPYNKQAPIAMQVEQSFAASRRNLGTDYVDALVLHTPLETFSKTLEAWRAMEQVYRQGGARRLGISNCYDVRTFHALCEAAQVPPTVLQNRFYRETGFDTELRTVCRQRGIHYQSFWTLTANPDMLKSAAVSAASRRLGLTPAQVLFHFLVFCEGLNPLTGTCSAEHMRQDLSAVSGGVLLTAQEEGHIRALLR